MYQRRRTPYGNGEGRIHIGVPVALHGAIERLRRLELLLLCDAENTHDLFRMCQAPLIPYKVYYNEAVHAGFSAAIDLKDPLHSLRIENATVGMGRCQSPGSCTPVKSEKRGACD